jgi:hypothetical protein
MANWFSLNRLKLFGSAPETPDDAAAIAETAEHTIEERLLNVKNKIARGGYRSLTETELTELHNDICKILEFVEHALSIIETSRRVEPIDVSLRRLRYVRGRVNTILQEQKTISENAA